MELNKVYCMDCLEGLKQLNDSSVDCIIADPPYGIDYQSARRTDTERFDKLLWDKYINGIFLKDCFRVIKETGAIYLFTRWDVFSEWKALVEAVGFKIKNCIVWDRVIHGLGDLNGSYAPEYDMILFAVKGKHLLKNGRPKDIIRVQRVDVDKLLHPTQKPLELIRQLIRNSTLENDTILDPFIGSGTTALAAKQLSRNFIGFEINQSYVEIANKRLSQATLRECSTNPIQ